MINSWQVTQKPVRGDDLLSNMEELTRDVKARSILGYSDHEMMAFRILGKENKPKSRITTLAYRRADFGLFRDLLRRIPWDTALEIEWSRTVD